MGLWGVRLELKQKGRYARCAELVGFTFAEGVDEGVLTVNEMSETQ